MRGSDRSTSRRLGSIEVVEDRKVEEGGVIEGRGVDGGVISETEGNVGGAGQSRWDGDG